MLRTSFALPLLAALAAAQTTVVKTGTLIDGRGHVLRNREIVVENGPITRIATRKAETDVDLSGLTVMPGWIDTHIHLTWYFNKDGAWSRAGRGRNHPQQAALYAEANAYTTLMGGFTTVQSVGAAIDGDVRDMVAAGAMPGPRDSDLAAPD